MEHMDVEIVGNKEGLIALRNVINAALLLDRASTTNNARPLYSSDGEGYIIKVISNNDDWHSPFWSEHPPFYHRVVD